MVQNGLTHSSVIRALIDGVERHRDTLIGLLSNDSRDFAQMREILDTIENDIAAIEALKAKQPEVSDEPDGTSASPADTLLNDHEFEEGGTWTLPDENESVAREEDAEEATVFHAAKPEEALFTAILTITPENQPEYVVKLLSDQEKFTIGRQSKGSESAPDIAIADSSISRKHCALTWTFYDKLMIEDLGSANGTRLNDIKVDGQEPVPEGAIIRIGRSTIAVSYEID